MIAFDLGPKFPLGQIVITTNAMRQLPHKDILAALRRHVRGDWGDMDAHDIEANEISLTEGHRLLSAYHASNGIKFWIISEGKSLGYDGDAPGRLLRGRFSPQHCWL